MRNIIPALGLLLSFLLPVSAQVTVEVTFEQDQFLAGEALPAAVKIHNRSGQTLHMGRDPDWLTFTVESRDGYVVTKTGEAPVTGEFTLETSRVATRRVDLAPYFALGRPGRYTVTATVRIKEWDGQVSSPPKPFDIVAGARLWSQEFGVPRPAGTSNQPPDLRRYTLQQANYVRKQLWLYLRVTDESEARVIKVLPIGPLIGFSRPEPQVDQLSRLHVLYQDGPRSFNYTVISPDGEIVLRQTYEYLGSRPRLQADQNGNIGVAGGVRRVTINDVPAPKKNDDASPPARP
jgi:hypothetical protein